MVSNSFEIIFPYKLDLKEIKNELLQTFDEMSMLPNQRVP